MANKHPIPPIKNQNYPTNCLCRAPQTLSVVAISSLVAALEILGWGDHPLLSYFCAVAFSADQAPWLCSSAYGVALGAGQETPSYELS